MVVAAATAKLIIISMSSHPPYVVPDKDFLRSYNLYLQDKLESQKIKTKKVEPLKKF